KSNLFVVVHLQRRLGDARLENAAHVVIPGQVCAEWGLPVRYPVHARRIDVGRQAFLETVQLVGPDEVHLAGEDGPVSIRTEVMRNRWDGSRQLGAVVVDPD